jgi:hypothetical protein
MPYKIHIVRSQDFVRVDGQNKLDFSESFQALRKIAHLCVERGVDNTLLDVRDVTSDLTVTEIYNLAKQFQLMGFTERNRLAVLHRYRAGEGAEFFAMCAEERNWHVRAFEDFEEAIGWFTHEEPAR